MKNTKMAKKYKLKGDIVSVFEIINIPVNILKL